MKNIKSKGTVVILLAALLFLSCNSKTGAQAGGGKSINSAEELMEYLNSQPANSPDKPIKVSMSVNDMMIKNVVEVIKKAGKYVSLDLSKSEEMTTIGDETFNEAKALVNIIIPKSVTSIGEGAFAKCSSLTSVTIPDSVTSIGEGAFYNCTSLTNVTIPNSVTSIGEGVDIPRYNRQEIKPH